MKERAQRAIAECRRIAMMSERRDSIMRRFLTPPMREVHAHLRARMEAAGMTVWLDAAGNLRGLSQPEAKTRQRLIVGSHIDTVPDAGAFDGVLGVTLAIECVEMARELRLPIPIEVIAFSEEEGVRFGVPFIGSRAVAGRFDPALLALSDADGITLEAAIRNFGLDPARMEEGAIGHDVLGMLEMHIEQGPVLENENLSVAAVDAIAGQSRYAIEFRGRANHAGTTPMPLRHDALAGAAEWIAAVEALALKTDGLVATVGRAVVEPNAGNVIPGATLLSLDLRHVRDSVRNEALEALLTRAEAIAARRALSVQCTCHLNQPAVPMDERMTALLVESMEAAGLPQKRMHSGAGHDAMVMAARVPTAMLFLRSPGGISHHPAESVREEDIEAALQVGRKFLERLAAEVG